MTQNNKQSKNKQENNEEFNIFLFLKSFNKELKELDQLMVLFSVLIIAGSFLYNVSNYEWPAFAILFGGVFGILWNNL